MTKRGQENRLEEIAGDFEIVGRASPNIWTQHKLGVDYDTEVVISSKGDIIYHCECGTTTFSNTKSITMDKPFIRCSYYYGCGKGISICAFLEPQGEPRIYLLKRK